MSSYGVPLSKRTAPVATISDNVDIDGTVAVAVNKDSTAISGCLVHGFVITSVTDATANAYVKVCDGGVAKLNVLVCETANTALASVFSFPAPIPIAGALTLQHSADSDILYQVLYTPY